MKFDLEWMQEYLRDPPGADEMAEALTHCGFLVETRDPAGSTEIWDMEATTNRPDVMCHRGMAREAAVATGTRLKDFEVSLTESGEPARESASIEITAPDLCRRYCGRVLRGVRIIPSPEWMQRRLENCGVRPINVVVDVTNYVLLETGQPLHAFDLEKLSRHSIIVRRAEPGETLRTLDGEERKLLPEDLVIADGSGAIALAGIMGGEDSEISETTTDILIESAHFEAIPIRRTARRLGMHTEASHRFERGCDPEMAPRAADRAASLIAQLTGASICPGLIDVHPRPWTARRMEIDPKKVSVFAGIEISPGRVAEIFNGLEFSPQVSDETIKLSVPSWREDVERPADLYEEVIRHVGYGEIPAVLPVLKTPPGSRNPNWELIDRARHAAMGCALAEAITYAFIDPQVDQRFKGWPLRIGESLVLDNPLAVTQGVMRSSLVPGLVSAARESMSLGENSAALFEQGRVFGVSETGEVIEAERLAIAVSGEGAGWAAGEDVDFFRIKGIVENLLEACFFPDLRWKPGGEPWLDQAKGAAVLEDSDGRIIGIVGALSVAETEKWNLRNRLWIAELNMEAAAVAPPLPVFSPLPRFPSVCADMTIEHEREMEYARLEEEIRKRADELVREISLIARWEGKGMAPGKIRSTIRLVYRHPERTLTQEEINTSQEKLRSGLAAELGVHFA